MSESSDPVLRRYQPADAGATRNVFEAAIRGTAARFYAPEQIDAWCPTTHDPQAWAAARARAWTIVAELDGHLVGFSDLRDDGELDMLFVAPEAGGRGVARALVAEVLAEARRRQLTKVTTRASRAARPAFERFGFVVDRPNENNIVRGVAVPNFEMHIDLPRPRP
ncbi:MAG TPA: GNAT family N-acetyltransferase [Propionibacteriaceae bacterium]|nr:GNAT family N-acetyltransferase [Micropruina sp.]HBY24217.1 GNAT family N-acetyltransferase [Propionibacteriaceae bacterium]